MFRRKHVLVSLSVASVTAVLACSSDTQATPRAIFDSRAAEGTHGTACTRTGQQLTIGTFGNPAAGRKDANDPNSDLNVPPVPVDDGGDFAQGTVSLTCSVKANGDNFDILATATLTGATGGSVTITGTVPPSGPGVSSAATLTMNLTYNKQTLKSSTCVVSYDTTLGHSVAAGRVWANIDCADSEDNQAADPVACDVIGTFRFENCAQ